MVSSSLDTSQNRMDPTFRTARLLANTGAFGAPQKTNAFVGLLTFFVKYTSGIYFVLSVRDKTSKD